MKQPTICSTGVDWVTMTTETKLGRESVQNLANAIRHRLTRGDEVVKPWRGLGYSGWQCGHARYGERGLYSTILQVSGEDADKLNLNPFSPTYKVTRVDLQVTLRFDGPVESLAYDLYRHLALERELDSTAPLYRFISSETGDTVYIGRRDSPVFIRLYDKTSEYSYGDKGLYWRYEVEYKKSAAPRVVSRLWEEPNRTAYIASQVASELKKRGVTPQFSSTTTVTAIAVGASVSTNEGRLNWLARCVAPVVSQLIALGYGEAVFHALDLRSIAKYRGK